MNDAPEADRRPAPRHEPFTTRQVYGALAAITFGIMVIVASCAAAWLYYVQFRSER